MKAARELGAFLRPERLLNPEVVGGDQAVVGVRPDHLRGQKDLVEDRLNPSISKTRWANQMDSSVHTSIY